MALAVLGLLLSLMALTYFLRTVVVRAARKSRAGKGRMLLLMALGSFLWAQGFALLLVAHGQAGTVRNVATLHIFSGSIAYLLGVRSAAKRLRPAPQKVTFIGPVENH